MGRIRTKDIKQTSARLREAYPDKFSKSFEDNKKALNEFKMFDSKRIRNKVAGYVTRLGVRRQT